MKYRFSKAVIAVIAIFIFFLTHAVSVFAEKLNYDRYAARSERTKSHPSSLSKALLHFPAFPFWLIKQPTDKSLVYIEKNYLDKKAKWIYDQMKSRGFTPHLNIISSGSLSFGADFDFVRIVRQKHRVPDLVLHGGIRYSQGYIFDVYATAGWEHIADTNFGLIGNFEYEDRMQEHFYGIGPNTSRGEGHVYGMETTTLEEIIRYEWTPSYRADFNLMYRNINVGGGKDGGRGQIGDGPVFSRENVPGLYGDEILTLGTELMHDTRDQKENSTSGGYQKLGLSYNEGVNSSKASFFRYLAELAQYFKLGSDRRVLAFHAYGEHNDEINSGIVPFHQMAKLGGYGAPPRLSHTLRSYVYNRFTDESLLLFNLEYRYNIWHYRELKLDAVFFWDEGQVFEEFSEFQLKDFRESYGVGFRTHIANVPVLSVEMAKGDEGVQFYVKSKMPF